MTAWYEKLKVGDPVIVIRRYEKIIAEITRVTKTQVSADGARFMKKALGCEIGASFWHGGYIEEYTEEKAKVILHNGHAFDPSGFIGRVGTLVRLRRRVQWFGCHRFQKQKKSCGINDFSKISIWLRNAIDTTKH